MNLDVERLRESLKDYYGTAMFNGFPMAMVGIDRVERASDEELVQMAHRNGVICEGIRRRKGI